MKDIHLIEEELRQIRRRADGGDAYSSLVYALAIEWGLMPRCDAVNSERYLQQAAPHDPYSMFRLATLQHKLGRDRKIVIENLKSAIARGVAEAAIFYAWLLYEDATTRNQSDEQLCVGAKMGDPLAHFTLATRKFDGIGSIPEDSVEWSHMIKSARMGYRPAQFCIAKQQVEGGSDRIGGIAALKQLSEAGMLQASEYLAFVFRKGLFGFEVNMQDYEIFRNRADRDRS